MDGKLISLCAVALEKPRKSLAGVHDSKKPAVMNQPLYSD